MGVVRSYGEHNINNMAMTCEVVVFNVDYRVAPGTRCPNNVLDFYEAIKYVASHAEDLGVDPARIAMAGESGGGYICAGAMIKVPPTIVWENEFDLYITEATRFASR